MRISNSHGLFITTFSFSIIVLLRTCITYHMNYNKLLSIILSVFFISTSFCQIVEDNGYYDTYNKSMELYNSKKYKEAVPYFEKAAQLRPDCDSYYNAACINSLAKNLTKGFKYLEISIKSGYADTVHMKEDGDLENLRSDKRWAEVSLWMEETKQKLYKEISKINIGCPASNLIPYEINGKWGYLNKQTKFFT